VVCQALAQSGAAAEVTLVDPDCIEQTNLSRQLLFRGGDIGRGKAEVAAREAARLSAALRVRPVALLLNAESEAALPGLFEVDCVLGAVDNIEARLFIDDRCRWHGVPLVDCGTQGAKGSVQVVVPGLTETYG
jgi:molybdopterin/thiamine biosynthesis adenylyltransferase